MKQLQGKEISPKVIALYDAVAALMAQGEDIGEMKVADITQKAGIGKGTAYEYFSNKEELICHAILYHVNRICSQIHKRMEETDDFKSGVYDIMESMDREIEDQDCFLRFIHLLSDSGGTGRTLKRLAMEKSGELCMPEEIVAKLVALGLKNGDIQNELSLDYVYLSLSSKILCYILYISGDKGSKGSEKENMRRMIYESLLKEFK